MSIKEEPEDFEWLPLPPDPPKHCWYCGILEETLGHVGLRRIKLEVEHQLPARRGGSDFDENLVAACRKCNWRKYTQTVEEFRRSEERRKGSAVRFYGEDHPERCRPFYLIGRSRNPEREPRVDTAAMDRARDCAQRLIDDLGYSKAASFLGVPCGLARFMRGDAVSTTTLLLIYYRTQRIRGEP